MSTREEALEQAKGLASSPKNIARVAEVVGSELARWAFEQWSLRDRASAKFARAEEMWFVREALEQATHEWIAAYHASLFPSGSPVMDATVGIGADTIALAGRGPVIGFDLDADRLEYAEHNLRVHDLEADLRCADCLSADWGTEYAFADPARRSGGVRTYDPKNFSPSPEALAEKMRRLRLGLLKLSPMMFDAYLDELGPRVEFVEFDRECREALIHTGSEARPGRFAVSVDRRESLSESPLLHTEEEPSEYILEASPAAVRAHCLGQFGIPGLGGANGYLTSRKNTGSPWVTPYAVLWHGRFDPKEIKARLIALNSKTPEIKQRGTKLDLADLRKKMRLGGSRPLFVMIWPVGKSLRAAITEWVT